MRKAVSQITVTLLAFTLSLLILLGHDGYLLYKPVIEVALSISCYLTLQILVYSLFYEKSFLIVVENDTM